MPSFYEFFAGGGMARAGLGPEWQCAFANDFDEAKADVYRTNWGSDDFHHGDVRKVMPAHLPGEADLAWASFPCQDLSLAGTYKGLDGDRSGTFWPFWKLMRTLVRQERAPKLIVVENVYGVLTANNGADFAAIAAAFCDGGYQFGAMIIDARHFVPQSRPRFFLVGVRSDLSVPQEVVAKGPQPKWHPSRLIAAQESLPSRVKRQWLWWKLPASRCRPPTLSEIVESNPTSVAWHTAAETRALVEMMSNLHREKLAAVQKLPGIHVGTIYKRTRKDAVGNKVQRAEVRFDKIAGCLRTPGGGSSLQTLMIVAGKTVRSRLISAREAARLMGLPDSYRLPANYRDAYQLAGDGVVVPVVSHLAQHIFSPILKANVNLMLALEAAV
ncbi:MAG TPA: DNA cytosine methyltransferase [Opitutaceae bacterium]|nr:DNA cytosine methyltransferase [Opitutaceae bacterium]